jgi:hypothetical protein
LDVQSSHLPPPEPHASDSVPKRQSPVAVQHPPQLDGPHVGATPSHVPFAVHAKPMAPQSRHCAARRPHALRSVPGRQRCSASQQPSQLLGLQSGLPPVPPVPLDDPPAPPVPTVTLPPAPVVPLTVVDEPLVTEVEPVVTPEPPAPVLPVPVDRASTEASPCGSKNSPVRPPHAARTRTEKSPRSRIGEVPAS